MWFAAGVPHSFFRSTKLRSAISVAAATVAGVGGPSAVRPNWMCESVNGDDWMAHTISLLVLGPRAPLFHLTCIVNLL